MIEQINDGTYSIDTAGLGGDEKVHIYMPPCRCGEIKNGVGLNTGDGGWLISVDDFLAMAEIIKQHQAELEAARNTKPEEDTG